MPRDRPEYDETMLHLSRMPNLNFGDHRTVYMREWMLLKGKGHMEGDVFVPSADNPIRGNVCTPFSLEWPWTDYGPGLDPQAGYIPWIAEMWDDYNLEITRQDIRRKCSRYRA